MRRSKNANHRRHIFRLLVKIAAFSGFMMPTVLTYRRGPYAAWRRRAFAPITMTVDGREIRYTLAERAVAVVPGFRMREVRRLCDGGHQTAILTTRHDLPIAVVAYRMFERWTQENFFRYMRQHFALDALLTYAVEPADPERTIPNPARKALRKQLAEARTTLKALEQEYGHAAQQNPEGRRPTMRGFKIAHGALGQQIRAQDRECRRLEVRLKALPERVPLKTVLDETEIVKLAPEAKAPDRHHQDGRLPGGDGLGAVPRAALRQDRGRGPGAHPRDALVERRHRPGSSAPADPTAFPGQPPQQPGPGSCVYDAQRPGASVPRDDADPGV